MSGTDNGYVIDIELPKGLPSAEIEAVRAEIATIEGVKNAGSGQTRGVLEEVARLWVDVEPHLSAIGTLLGFLGRLVGLFQKHGLGKATLRVGEVTLQMENPTADDIKKAAEAIGALGTAKPGRPRKEKNKS